MVYSLRRGQEDITPLADFRDLLYELGIICLQDLACMADNSMAGHPIYSEPWAQRSDWTAFASELKESMEASAEACLQEQIDKATTFGMEDIATALSTIQTQLSSPTWLPSQKYAIGEHVAKLLAQVAQGGLARNPVRSNSHRRYGADRMEPVGHSRGAEDDEVSASFTVDLLRRTDSGEPV